VVIWLPLLLDSGGDPSMVEVSGCFSSFLRIGGDGYDRDVAGSGGDSEVEGDGE